LALEQLERVWRRSVHYPERPPMASLDQRTNGSSSSSLLSARRKGRCIDNIFVAIRSAEPRCTLASGYARRMVGNTDRRCRCHDSAVATW
jgi:hypothetical protein